MATATPLEFELEIAVEKLRAEQPLTERERAIVRQRGLELAGCTDRLIIYDDDLHQGVEVDPEDEQEHLESIVESEANFRDGRYVTAEKLCADLGIPWP